MNAPEKIYLQIHDDNEPATWCEDHINEDDVGYVRMDIATAKIEELTRYIDIRQGAWIERGNIMHMFTESHNDTKKELADLRAKVEEMRALIYFTDKEEFYINKFNQIFNSTEGTQC